LDLKKKPKVSNKSIYNPKGATHSFIADDTITTPLEKQMTFCIEPNFHTLRSLLLDANWKEVKQNEKKDFCFYLDPAKNNN